MENETLVVLEEGNETTLEGPLECCLSTMMDLL